MKSAQSASRSRNLIYRICSRFAGISVNVTFRPTCVSITFDGAAVAKAPVSWTFSPEKQLRVACQCDEVSHKIDSSSNRLSNLRSVFWHKWTVFYPNRTWPSFIKKKWNRINSLCIFMVYATKSLETKKERYMNTFKEEFRIKSKHMSTSFVLSVAKILFYVCNRWKPPPYNVVAKLPSFTCREGLQPWYIANFSQL